MNSGRIYLDNAATTPLRLEVIDAMREVAADADYNPSSLHAEGRRAAGLLDSARDRAASVLGVHRSEITFTSGGTESDNLAVAGTMRASAKGSRVVCSAAEHHAVLVTVERLADEGYQPIVLPVGSDGHVDVDAFSRELEPGTGLASVMYANNETGVVTPIAALATAARGRGVAFHTDAVQAPRWLALDVRSLGVDMLSLSAHKFGGPKGVGLLYARRGSALHPVLSGGGQEFGRRPGTENLAGIAGMVTALELAAAERAEATARVGQLRDRLESGICSTVPDVRVNGGEADRLPNICNASFAGVDSAALLMALDLAGVAVSAGSACTSGSPEPSHVLAAMGLEPRWRQGAIRFSLGPTTDTLEIGRVLEILPAVVADLRRPSAAGTRSETGRRDG
ncbi:MAG TPA: cysteine desulfurase family protein [Candidatus Cybelea sp.]|nr:cysteine desulfurase family protein [Candidatus Cybelea sp.]